MIAFSITGKKVKLATISTFGSRPKPNQIESTGAIAIVGITW